MAFKVFIDRDGAFDEYAGDGDRYYFNDAGLLVVERGHPELRVVYSSIGWSYLEDGTDRSAYL